MTPEAGLAVIREKTRAALGRLGDFEPYRVASPPIVELSLKNYRPVELLGYLRGVERIGSHTIRYEASDMVDAENFLSFVLGYSVSLTP
jgi:D-aminopeptidase